MCIRCTEKPKCTKFCGDGQRDECFWGHCYQCACHVNLFCVRCTTCRCTLGHVCCCPICVCWDCDTFRWPCGWTGTKDRFVPYTDADLTPEEQKAAKEMSLGKTFGVKYICCLTPPFRLYEPEPRLSEDDETEFKRQIRAYLAAGEEGTAPYQDPDWS